MKAWKQILAALAIGAIAAALWVGVIHRSGSSAAPGTRCRGDAYAALQALDQNGPPRDTAGIAAYNHAVDVYDACPGVTRPMVHLVSLP